MSYDLKSGDDTPPTVTVIGVDGGPVRLAAGIAQGILTCAVFAGVIYCLHRALESDNLAITWGLYLITASALVVAAAAVGMWMLIAAAIAQCDGRVGLWTCVRTALILAFLIPPWEAAVEGFLATNIEPFAPGLFNVGFAVHEASWLAAFAVAWLLIAGLFRVGFVRSLLATVVGVVVPLSVGYVVWTTAPDWTLEKTAFLTDYVRMTNIKDSGRRLIKFAESQGGMPENLDDINPDQNITIRPTNIAIFPRVIAREGYRYVAGWAGRNKWEMDSPETLIVLYEEAAEGDATVFALMADESVRWFSADALQGALAATSSALAAGPQRTPDSSQALPLPADENPTSQTAVPSPE